MAKRTATILRNEEVIREYDIEDFSVEAQRLKTDAYKLMVKRAQGFVKKLAEKSTNKDKFSYKLS